MSPSADRPRLSPWLRDRGFHRNPFAFYRAEDQTWDMLEQIYVEHGHEDLMADVEQSAVLLVPAGGGRTTARRYVELRHRKQRQPDTLVVVYDYGRAARVASSDLESHTPFFLAAVASSIWDFITNNMSVFLAAGTWSQPWWWRLLDQYLPGEPLAARFYHLLDLYDPAGLLFGSGKTVPHQKPYLKQLFAQLVETATLAEMQTVCFHLGIEYENFSTKKSEMIRELLEYLDRRERIGDLIEIANRIWPNVKWGELMPPAGEMSGGDALTLYEQLHKSFKRGTKLRFSPLGNNGGLVELLQILSHHLPDLGITRVHALVDSSQEHNSQALHATITSLISEPDLYLPGFSWKFFLPKPAGDLVNKSLTYRRLDVPARVADWNSERLLTLLQGRASWIGVEAFNAIVGSPDLPELDKELVALISSVPAGWGEPRTLLWLGNELVDYLERTGNPLTRETWEAFTKDLFPAHA